MNILGISQNNQQAQKGFSANSKSQAEFVVATSQPQENKTTNQPPASPLPYSLEEPRTRIIRWDPETGQTYETFGNLDTPEAPATNNAEGIQLIDHGGIIPIDPNIEANGKVADQAVFGNEEGKIPQIEPEKSGQVTYPSDDGDVINQTTPEHLMTHTHAEYIPQPKEPAEGNTEPEKSGWVVHPSDGDDVIYQTTPGHLNESVIGVDLKEILAPTPVEKPKQAAPQSVPKSSNEFNEVTELLNATEQIAKEAKPEKNLDQDLYYNQLQLFRDAIKAYDNFRFNREVELNSKFLDYL